MTSKFQKTWHKSPGGFFVFDQGLSRLSEPRKNLQQNDIGYVEEAQRDHDHVVPWDFLDLISIQICQHFQYDAVQSKQITTKKKRVGTFHAVCSPSALERALPGCPKCCERGVPGAAQIAPGPQPFLRQDYWWPEGKQNRKPRKKGQENSSQLL